MMHRFNRLSCGIFLVGACLTLPALAAAPEIPPDFSRDFSMGLNITNYAGSYAAGVTLYSPYFGASSFYAALGADYADVQGVPQGGSTTVAAPFGLFKLGVYSGHPLLGGALRTYSGIGIVLLDPGSQVSASGAKVGAYATLGVEFFLRPAHDASMFFEMGGMGSGAVADRLIYSPMYANGFTSSFGVRYFF